MFEENSEKPEGVFCQFSSRERIAQENAAKIMMDPVFLKVLAKGTKNEIIQINSEVQQPEKIGLHHRPQYFF